MKEIHQFDCRWLKEKPRHLLPRIKALAEKNGCRLRVWENPCGREGVLFWIETYADGAGGRMESFRADWDDELRNWFLFESQGKKP